MPPFMPYERLPCPNKNAGGRQDDHFSSSQFLEVANLYLYKDLDLTVCTQAFRARHASTAAREVSLAEKKRLIRWALRSS